MLYKKYHRNYVKQFKKGTKFVYKYSLHENAVKDIDIVEIEPHRFKYNVIKIQMLGKYNKVWLDIVFYNGKINDDVKIEDVVQKIS